MPKNVAVTFTCDICGTAIDETDIYAYALCYSLPGKNAGGKIMKSISCKDEQHFGCCPEHAAAAAKNCIDHLEEMRKEKFNAVEENI